MQGDPVHVDKGVVPSDYHCGCQYCAKSIGELRPPDGSYYSRHERNKYYDPLEKGKKSGSHIAKTPLHIARWAVQAYTRPGDWVLDPTIGAGTTAVEAITQHRNAAGMEIQYDVALKANVARNLTNGVSVHLRMGDARNIRTFLDEIDVQFQLVVNNPPYSGDESHPSPAKEGRGPEHRDKETYFFYEDGLPNLAFLKETQEYWDTMARIYRDCAERLVLGGHFVIGVKDMMKSKKPFLLHKIFAELLEGSVGLRHKGTAFLKHYPTTLHLNTYEKKFGVPPPFYQTIVVFQKV